MSAITYECYEHGRWDAAKESGCPKCVSVAREKIQDLKDQIGDYRKVFDLQWKADLRAVARWRDAAPGRDMKLPDRADLCGFLLERVEALEKELALLRRKR